MKKMNGAWTHAWKRSRIRLHELGHIFLTCVVFSLICYAGLSFCDSFLMFWLFLAFIFFGGILTISWLMMFLERFIKHFLKYKRMNRNV